MATIETKPFELNSFWEKTPKALKYFIIIALIIAGSYYLFSKGTTIAQIKQIDKIEESINTTYSLINQFQDFEKTQYAYNTQTMTYLKNIYSLVDELNDNANKKLDMIIKAGGSNTNQIIEKITLLNESFEKLHKAYSPKDELKVPEIPDPKIVVRKIEKK
jgi:hypothetical protein